MIAVEGHHDLSVLEDRLLGLVRSAKTADPLAPVAVIVPTSRLRRHLLDRLAASFDGLLGVTVLHHHALAREAAAAGGIDLPREIPRRIQEAILLETLRAGGGGIAAEAERRPGIAAALAATMSDLRDAGADPAAAARAAGLSGAARETIGIFAAFDRRMAALGGRGLADRAGLRRAALGGVAGYAARFRLVVHYGAYELIGVHLEILKEIDRGLAVSGGRLVWLIPHHPEAPAWEYARSFVASALGGSVTPIEPDAAIAGAAGRPLLADRLPLLHAEEAAAAPGIGSGLDFFHAQGAAAEIREAARRILAMRERLGVPLSRLALIARSLEPYAHHLEPVLHLEHGIPFATSAVLPALREARAQAALHLARIVSRDVERRPLLDLARSGLLRIDGRDVAPAAHGWDRLSRDFRVARGARAWTDELPRWVEAWEPYAPADADDEMRARLAALREGTIRSARALAGAVREILAGGAALGRARGWGAWAEAMRDLCRRFLDGFDAEGGGTPDGGARAVLSILEEMGDLDEAEIPFRPSEAIASFEQALRARTIPIGAVGGGGRPAGDGGLNVLDAMQARGLLFEGVALIGFNADLFPQRPREDPFLRDADRRILRAGAAPTLPLKSARREEERLLLAHLLGCARRRLAIGWQHADEAGRARVPSLALREVARAGLGAADLETAREAARRVPGHPEEAARDAVERFGFLPAAEARTAAALQAGSPSRLAGRLDRLPGGPLRGEEARIVPAGLALLAAADRFAPGELAYDGFVGGSVPPPAAWSPSRLEMLGRCPLQYFFRHVLRVDEMEEAAEGYEVDAREIGERVHEVLHAIYRELIDRGEISRRGADPSKAARRVVGELVAEAWSSRMEPVARRIHARYPLLWEALSTLWLNALTTFVLYDLAEMGARGERLVDLESVASGAIRPGPGVAIALRARFDRVSRREGGGIVVADYKTSGNIESHVAPLDMLRGTRLQMPLYLLLQEARAGELGLAGEPIHAEVLGVGPSFAEGPPPESPRAGDASSRALLEAAAFAALRPGIEETVGVLAGLAAAGAYPLNPEPHRCGYCPFQRACRRLHAPTLLRVGSAPEALRFQALRRKTRRAPLLAQVREEAE